MEKETMRKVTFRIIPFLMVCYFIAFVDRVNAGFAALQMNQDIGLSSAAFWALATEWMSAGVAAAAIAQVNAIGNIGGFLGSYLLGVIKDATGSYSLGLLPLAALSGAGCIMVLALGRNPQQGVTAVQEPAH